MAVSLSAALVGSTNPQKVQVVLSGMTVGNTYTVTGVWSGGSWPIRGGGPFVATGTQVVLVDVLAPVNTPIWYQVVSGATSTTSAQITVPYSDGNDSKYLLQSLDGMVTVPFTWLDDDAPREVQVRNTLHWIAGRPDPVARMDVAGRESGQITALTTSSGSDAMRSLLALGGAALLRTDGSVRDLPAVDFVLLTRASNQLHGVGTSRRWAVAYQVIGDPEPNRIVPTATWDDFDGVYAASTWSAFDSEWTGLTWDKFDRTDWTAHA